MFNRHKSLYGIRSTSVLLRPTSDDELEVIFLYEPFEQLSKVSDKGTLKLQ